MAPSNFLKKEDCGGGLLVTIAGCKQYQMPSGDDEWCLEFAECDKPMVLKVTNMRIIESIFGSDDTADWIGKQVVIYNDPTVSFGGKITGGIRVRASKRPQPVASQPVNPPKQPVAAASDSDSIPF
jgi:hypothetical protein